MCGCGFVVSAQVIMLHSYLVKQHESCPNAVLTDEGAIIEVFARLAQHLGLLGFVAPEIAVVGVRPLRHVPALPALRGPTATRAPSLLEGALEGEFTSGYNP